MFQLLVAMMSVVLVAALGIAAAWYGGYAFTDNHDKVDYGQIRNGAMQIEAALSIYFGDHGAYPTGTSEDIMNALVTGKYLTIPPSSNGFTYELQSDQIIRALTSQEQCYSLNKLSGITTADECPPCSDPAYARYIACEQ